MLSERRLARIPIVFIRCRSGTGSHPFAVDVEADPRRGGSRAGKGSEQASHAGNIVTSGAKNIQIEPRDLSMSLRNYDT